MSKRIEVDKSHLFSLDTFELARCMLQTLCDRKEWVRAHVGVMTAEEQELFVSDLATILSNEIEDLL